MTNNIQSYEQAQNYVSIIRSMIQHENTLQNQRLNWMWTLQGLLFGATSFIWSENQIAFYIIAVVGLLSCISIGYSIDRSLKAIKDLLSDARKFKSNYRDFLFPPTIGARKKAIEWLLPGRIIPWGMGLAWVGLIILQKFV